MKPAKKVLRKVVAIKVVKRLQKPDATLLVSDVKRNIKQEVLFHKLYGPTKNPAKKKKIAE